MAAVADKKMAAAMAAIEKLQKLRKPQVPECENFAIFFIFFNFTVHFWQSECRFGELLGCVRANLAILLMGAAAPQGDYSRQNCQEKALQDTSFKPQVISGGSRGICRRLFSG